MNEMFWFQIGDELFKATSKAERKMKEAQEEEERKKMDEEAKAKKDEKEEEEDDEDADDIEEPSLPVAEAEGADHDEL